MGGLENTNHVYINELLLHLLLNTKSKCEEERKERCQFD